MEDHSLKVPDFAGFDLSDDRFWRRNGRRFQLPRIKFCDCILEVLAFARMTMIVWERGDSSESWNLPQNLSSDKEDWNHLKNTFHPMIIGSCESEKLINTLNKPKRTIHTDHSHQH